MYTSVYRAFQTNPTDVRSSKLIIHCTAVYTALYKELGQSHIKQTKIYCNLQVQKINYQSYICKANQKVAFKCNGRWKLIWWNTQLYFCGKPRGDPRCYWNDCWPDRATFTSCHLHVGRFSVFLCIAGSMQSTSWRFEFTSLLLIIHEWWQLPLLVFDSYNFIRLTTRFWWINIYDLLEFTILSFNGSTAT
mgnify:CR=1 FL=1